MAVVLGAAAHASAQTDRVITTVKKDGKTPLSGVQVQTVVNGQPNTVGATDTSGRLRFGSSEPFGPVTHLLCPVKSASSRPANRLLIGSAENMVEDYWKVLLERSQFDGCTFEQLPPMRPDNDYLAVLNDSLATSFFRKPATWLGVAAGASLTYFAATKGSGSDDAPPGGTNNPSFSDVLGAYNFNGTVQQRGACSFNNFQSRVTFSGSLDALNADLLEAILRAYKGAARPEGSGFQFNTSASGTVPGLGSYTGTLIGVLLADGTATATETLNFPCGTVTIAQSGRKQ
jgi:hypothetical protein